MQDQTVIEEETPLPEGWRMVRIKDVCKTTSGGTPPRGVKEYYGGSIPWIKSGELKDTEIFQSEEKITDSGLAHSSAKLHPANTLLIAMYGANVGRLAILRTAATTNQAVCAIYPGDAVSLEFLFFYLLTKRLELVETSFGGAQPNISQDIIRNLEFPVPPTIEEQRRIASILDMQMKAVEQARVAVEEQLEAANLLRRSYFAQSFNGIIPLTIDALAMPAPVNWTWERLGAIARLESGHTPSRFRPEWWGGDIGWLALPDIRELDGKTVFETKEFTNELGISNSSARILPAGTVCLSRTASVGFVTVMGKPMATSQDFVNWICGDRIDSYYLSYVLQASRDYLLSLASGAIHKTIYMPTVKDFRVCLPDINEQRRIVTTLDSQIDKASRLVNSLGQQRATIGNLPAASLRKAFAGGI